MEKSLSIDIGSVYTTVLQTDYGRTEGTKGVSMCMSVLQALQWHSYSATTRPLSRCSVDTYYSDSRAFPLLEQIHLLEGQ